MSQNTLLFCFFGFGIVAVAAIVFLAIRGEQERTREMAYLAQRLGLEFFAKNWNGPRLPQQFKTTLLQRTRGAYRNAMTGTFGGLAVFLFDYIHGQGKQRRTHTMACFTQNVELAPFTLRPEGVLDRIGDRFVHSDIDFESYPEFSERYVLESPEESATRKLFSPGLLSYFQQIPREKKWHVESAGINLILYRPGLPVKVAQLELFLNEASSIARAVFDSRHYN